MKIATAGSAIVISLGIKVLAHLHRLRRGWQLLTGRASKVKGERSLFYRTIWGDAAAALGATLVDLGDSFLEIRTASGVLRLRENYTSLDDPVTLQIAGDKPLVHRLLREQGLSVPIYRACNFADHKAASEFIGAAESPFVVKPARGTGAGNGVTAGLRRTRGLMRAMALAGAYCEQVILERQVEGDNYRLLYLDGELLDAVVRLPPGVDGDGSSSLRRLISKENRRRREQGFEVGQTLIKTDWELRQTLKRQGLRLRSVPGVGERVKLKSVVSDNSREENRRVTGLIGASLVRSGSVAATTIGVRLAGVDIVTPDPLVSLEESGGAIIEVNTTPGLHFHYVGQGGGASVARAVLERLMAAENPPPGPVRADRLP